MEENVDKMGTNVFLFELFGRVRNNILQKKLAFFRVKHSTYTKAAGTYLASGTASLMC